LGNKLQTSFLNEVMYSYRMVVHKNIKMFVLFLTYMYIFSFPNLTLITLIMSRSFVLKKQLIRTLYLIFTVFWLDNFESMKTKLVFKSFMTIVAWLTKQFDVQYIKSYSLDRLMPKFFLVFSENIYVKNNTDIFIASGSG
jgi:hypothetical protein